MRKINKRLVFILIPVLVVCFCLGVINTPQVVAEELNENFEDDSLLVVLTREATLTCKTYTPADFYPHEIVSVDNMFMNNGSYEVTDENRQILFVRFSTHSKENVLLMCEILGQRVDVEYATPNYIIEDSLGSVEPTAVGTGYSNNVGYEGHMSISNAQAIASSNPVTVGIIDTGLDFTHPAFSGKIDYTASCFITSSGTIQQCVESNTSTWLTDTDGHGTGVAGILGSTRVNDIGGLFPCVRLGIIDCYESAAVFSAYRVSKAFEYATTKGIKIVNWSCALPNTNYSNYSVLLQAIQNYPGLFITIAGNGSSNIDVHNVYPACEDIDRMIVVGGIDRLRGLASISNYGAENVDLMAPADNVCSAFPTSLCGGESCTNANHITSNYHRFTGTSFAAPFVAGVAAMIWSKYPTLTLDYVKSAIIENTSDLINLNAESYCVSGGFINAYSALTSESATHTHTLSYSNITSTTHKQTCTVCGYNTVVPHLWRVISKTTTGHVKQCNCGHTVDEAHTWVQNALGGYICSVCRQTSNFIPGIQSLLTPAGRLALQAANLQHGQVALIEGLPIIYFNGEYYLISESTTQVPYPIPPALQTE